MKVVSVATLALCSFLIAAAPPQDAGQNLVQFLNWNIDWYRHMQAGDPSPLNAQDLMFRDGVRASSLQAMKLSFDYARAQIPLVENSTTRPAPAQKGGSKNLAQSQAAIAQQIAQLKPQIDQLNEQIKSATPETADTLNARRNKLVAQLNLSKARQDVLAGFAGFVSDLSGGSENLRQQVENLQREVPQLQDQNGSSAKSQAAAGEAASNGQATRPEANGLIALFGEVFTMQGRLSEVTDLTDRTKKLMEGLDKRRLPLREQLLAAIHQADAIAQAKDTNDANQLASQRQQLDALTEKFKDLAAAAVPLGEERAVLESVQNSLADWHSSLWQMYRRVLYSLLIRLGIMAGIILLLLGFSKIWGRVTLRYVTDNRRRRQFLLMRRIVVSSVIVIVIIASVVAELGQLATFAGLITAGIAVALQTVILSGFAYFFFVGRYGVRVGDRVTISGITGDVVDIGLFRLYLMELSGNGRDLQASGRIVVFSNSVLFQPNAFFKQLPGSDYTFHEVALTLAPNTDHEMAEQRLLNAVESVFEEYRPEIERQYEQIKDSLHLPIPAPKPQGRLRFVDAGLEFVVRYPVEIHHAAEVDDKITRRLLEAIEEEPKLKLVPSSTPKIQPAEGSGNGHTGSAAAAPGAAR